MKKKYFQLTALVFFGILFHILPGTALLSGPSKTTPEMLSTETAPGAHAMFSPMSGEFTIGGTAPDFHTFNEAVAALTSRGVDGPVVFSVRAGTYEEQVVISAIPGTSSQNTVIFRSATNLPDDVRLTFYSTSYQADYTLLLDGPDWVTFRGMTLSAANPLFPTVVSIRNRAEHNQFINNRLEAPTGGNASTRGNGLVYYEIYTTASHFNRFVDNLFQGGVNGLTTDWGYGAEGWEISGNTFINQEQAGLSLNDMWGMNLSDNKVEDGPASNTNYTAIILDDVERGSVIARNSIILSRGEVGLELESLSDAGPGGTLIVNNFVYIGGEGKPAQGILFPRYDIQYVDIFHNTVRIDRKHPVSAAINHLSSGTRFLNNILANYGGGYAFFENYNNGFTSDHNVFFSNGPAVCSYKGVNLDLSGWAAVTGLDQNSVEVDPFFTTDQNYAIRESSLDGTALPIDSILTDIEGKNRDPLQSDIGCYEFDLLPVDGALAAVLLPAVPFAAGAQTVRLIIKNNGTDPLSSADISWKFDGITQPKFNWKGFLKTNERDTVRLGPILFQAAFAHELEAWIERPNAIVDPFPANDTIRVDGIYCALNGNYTLGGAVPDFASFRAAELALESGGVLGPTNILVRDGTYNEQISLETIPGSDSLRPIRFRSLSGDSSRVILQFASVLKEANYTLRLNGCSWITFQGLTVRSYGSSYSNVIYITNGAHHLSFLHNRVIAPVLTNPDMCFRMDNLTLNEYLQLKSNLIIGNNTGVFASGRYDTEQLARGLLLIDNQFRGQRTNAILCQWQSHPLISGNLITDNDPENVFTAIKLTESTGGRIQKNRIDLQNGRFGISLGKVVGTAGDPVVVANNFVRISGTGSAFGILTSGSAYQDIIHNSVHIRNAGWASENLAFWSNDNSNIRLLNNILTNTAGGWVIRIIVGSIESNHNNMYTTGSTLGSFGGAPYYTDLEHWVTGTGLDSASLSVDPGFPETGIELRSNNDLLDRAGIAVTTVLDDIDGSPRDPVHPDIGADEFTSEALDAAVFNINMPRMLFPEGSRPVNLSLVNLGLDTLRSIEIGWQVNGMPQEPGYWSGILAPGDILDSLHIGSFSFKVGIAHTITTWTAMPNGIADSYPTNDTARLDNLYAALGGTYTIGGAAPDFLTIGVAVDAMIAGGVFAPVTFEIRDGLYQEQIRIPEIEGADAMRTVSFQSASGDHSKVIWMFAATSPQTNYTLLLDGADWMVFRDLTLRAQGMDYGTVVKITNQANHHLFERNLFEGRPVTTDSPHHYLLNSYDNNLNQIVRENAFLNGSRGMTFNYANSSSPGSLIVAQNRFLEQFYNGIHLSRPYAVEMASNYFENSNNAKYRAVEIQGPRERIEIVRNQIFVRKSGIGIHLGNYGSPVIALIANNFIKIDGSAFACGINNDRNCILQLYHNTIRVTSTYYNNGATVAMGNSPNGIMVNNLLTNEGGGKVIEHQSNRSYYSDYNNFYFTGDFLGSYQSTSHKDLESWRAGSGLDLHSTAIDPFFLTEDGYEIGEVDLNNTGIPVPEVSSDITGEARSKTHPDVGVLEFAPRFLIDAGISAITHPGTARRFAAGEQPVVVVLKNNGSGSIQTVRINWRVNDEPQSPYQWTGSLRSGERDTVVVGFYDFDHRHPHSIQAYTSYPNNQQTDPEGLNDTTLVDGLYTALAGNYTIGGTAPDFPNFSRAVETLNNGGILGPVVFEVRDGTYDEYVALKKIRGTSNEQTITFQSESGEREQVILTYEPTPSDFYATISLIETQYVTFRALTIEARGQSRRTLIESYQTSGGHQFINNVIRCEAGVRKALVVSEYPYDTLQPGMVFIGNLLQNGDIGIYLNASPSAGPQYGSAVIDNIFENQLYYPFNAYYQRDLQVIGNHFIGGGSIGAYAAISLFYCDGATRVLNNRISGKNGHGIELIECIADAEAPGLIANNFVRAENYFSRGAIKLVESSFQRLYHNSVVQDSDNPAYFGAQIIKGRDIHLYNNIFTHSGMGAAIYIDQESESIRSDFNNLYTEGSTLAVMGNTQAGKLKEWRSLSGMDGSSVSVPPLFVSEEDLHTLQPLLDGAGHPLPDVPEIREDIDGEVRNLIQPDIGADEVDLPPAHDLAVGALLAPVPSCTLPSRAAIRVTIDNLSRYPVSGFFLAYQIEDNAPVSETAAGIQIPGGGAINYVFHTTADLSAYQEVRLRVFTSLNTDTAPQNDTLEVLLRTLDDPEICTCGPDFLDLSGQDIAEGNYTAESTIRSDGFIGAGNQVTFRTGERISLLAGFTVAREADFTALIDRCHPPAELIQPPPEVNTTANASVKWSLTTFPNPFRNRTHLQYQIPEPTAITITLHDFSGRLIRTLVPITKQLPGTYHLDLDGSGLPGGLYHVKLSNQEQQLTTKVVLMR